jgi:Zinc-binding dehydrogenase
MRISWHSRQITLSAGATSGGGRALEIGLVVLGRSSPQSMPSPSTASTRPLTRSAAPTGCVRAAAWPAAACWWPSARRARSPAVRHRGTELAGFAAGALLYLLQAITRRRFTFYSVTAERGRHPDWFVADLTALFQLLAAGKIQPIVARRFPWRDARAANELLESGTVQGWRRGSWRIGRVDQSPSSSASSSLTSTRMPWRSKEVKWRRFSVATSCAPAERATSAMCAS